MKHPSHYDTDEATSKRMSHVRLKKGKAETMLAKALWHNGYRYRLNYKKMPGSPDIALTKKKVAIFIDGEFWHGYDWETRKEKLSRNKEYWINKIEENMARDKRVDKQLHELGWMTIHFWEKDVLSDLEKCVRTVEAILSE